MRMFDDIYAVYTPAHAWIYETMVAPAVYRSRTIIDQRFLDLLPRGARVLDVGSGGGRFTTYMAEQRADLDLLGVDLSPPQIRRSTRAAKRLGGRARFQLGSALQLDFEAATFDGVLTYGSIKHWPDPARGLAECMRVLKPGGPFLLTEADRSCSFEDADDFCRHYRSPGLFHAANLAIFRTWIAGRSLDVDDVRRLAAALPLRDLDVGRVKGSPLLYIAGRRAE